jgi:RNA polymerase sigma-70 factor (ECF subfamily)
LRRTQRRPAEATAQISGEEIEQLSAFFTNHASKSNAESKLISQDLANKLLARLSPEDRMALTLLEVEELSVKEIAEITDWSVAKVKVRAHRARLALRRVLKDFI